MRWVNTKMTCMDCGLEVQVTAKEVQLPLTDLVGKCDCGEETLDYDSDTRTLVAASRPQETTSAQ